MSQASGLKHRLRNADKEERASILDGLPYQVGFGKPPLQTRFAVGNHVGKRGRPKGCENLLTILEEEAAARIEVTEGGKQSKMSKQRVGMRQLINKMAAGDMKALAIFIDLLRKAGKLQAAVHETPMLDERDVEMFERAAAFFESAAGGSPERGGKS